MAVDLESALDENCYQSSDFSILAVPIVDSDTLKQVRKPA